MTYCSISIPSSSFKGMVIYKYWKKYEYYNNINCVILFLFLAYIMVNHEMQLNEKTDFACIWWCWYIDGYQNVSFAEM